MKFRIGMRCLPLLAALILIPGGAPSASAQSKGLAFWEPKPEKVAALVREGRGGDAARYNALRAAFVEYGCTADRMQEQTIGRHKERNLICVLPGQSSETIVVAARYDHDAMMDTYSTWLDAATLPLLFHALQAMPRQHTIVFAAIGGRDAESQFLAAQRVPQQGPPPVAQVVIDRIGLGSPFCYARDAARAAASALSDTNPCAEAYRVAAAMHLPLQPPQDVSQYQSIQRLRSILYKAPLFDHSPVAFKALLYSDANPDQQTDMYPTDFDFAAWFLSLIDRSLPHPAREPVPGP